MLVFLITVYQKIVSPALKQLLGMQSMCRFTPSCSEYAKISIKKYGVIKGSSLAGIRLMHCQPFSNAKISV
jgi:putative membrane protein insertion efficiency factor